MAVKTPDSILQESMGSLKLLICDYSTTNIDDGDTYDPSTNIVAAWFNASLDPTQGGEGMNIAISGTELTFHAPEDDVTGKLFILTRG
jgi:hypothetical protein